MKQIKISFSKGTGIDPFFDNINSISVDDNPFAGGGFGNIYYARGFNGGQNPTFQQVIKVFKPSTVGKEEHSWKTICKLQEKLIEEMELNFEDKTKFLEQYPSLIALPQFVFEGTLDGRKVKGYATNNLNVLGFVSFEKVIDVDDSPYIEQFESKDMVWRFTMAYHLARGFNLLYKMHFLHADISSDNIFVSLSHPICAILDFDSGAIVETMEDNPSTFGKFQTWLAPEISFQLKNGLSFDGNSLVSINAFTDAWSVANALLNMLVLMPAYYLVDMSERSLKTYVGKYTWPEVDFNDNLFDPDNEEGYNYFHQMYTNMLPDEVKREFVCTFSKGVFKPALRTSYNIWERIFKNLIPEKDRLPSIYDFTPLNLKLDDEDITVPLTPQPSQDKSELVNYVNALVVDIVNGDETMKHHEPFICEMAKKTGLNGKEIISEIKDFIKLYRDCIEDKVITKFEKSNLVAQGEMALVTEDTINKLLMPYKKV